MKWNAKSILVGEFSFESSPNVNLRVHVYRKGEVDGLQHHCVITELESWQMAIG